MIVYAIEDIQAAILAALKVSDLNGLCEKVDHYEGQIEDLLSRLEQTPIVRPQALVLYQGSTFTGSGSNPYLDEQTFSVMLIVKDLRGGNDLKTSMNALVEAAKTALVDQQFGLDISPMVPVRIQAVKVTRTYSVFRFDVKTIFEMA